MDFPWLCGWEWKRGAAEGDEGTAGAGPGLSWILGKSSSPRGCQALDIPQGMGTFPREWGHSQGSSRSLDRVGLLGCLCQAGVGLDPCESFPLRLFQNSMSAPGTRMFKPHLSGSLAFPQARSPRIPGIPGQTLENVFAKEPKFPQLCPGAPPSQIPEQPPRPGCCSGSFQQQNPG